ncbi:MAG: DUF3800 domain-containing protein [Planctomycetes bacterium]|nr:DUF3800 domain-containing protein [Planctomycetota bacterium]
MSKYRIYIDEVGNSDLGSSENPNHRFLSLTGVIVDLKYIATTVHPQMERIKVDFFESHPDDPILFHRKEMLNAKPPFTGFRNSEFRSRFDVALLQLLVNWDYKVITVCIDKLNHKETYTTWRYDPYHYCLKVMLERYIFFLDSVDSQGDVMAESRGGKEDRRLKDSFNGLFVNGTDWIDPGRMQQRLTSSQLKVKNKANNIAGLQLSDLLAHPSRNEILHENNLLGKEFPPFGKKVIEILRQKYYRRGERVFGKKLL